MGRPSEALRACPWPQWGALAQVCWHRQLTGAPIQLRGPTHPLCLQFNFQSVLGHGPFQLKCLSPASGSPKCVCCSWICPQVSCPRGAGSGISSCFCVPRKHNTPTSHPEAAPQRPQELSSAPRAMEARKAPLAWGGGEDGVTAPQPGGIIGIPHVPVLPESETKFFDNHLGHLC